MSYTLFIIGSTHTEQLIESVKSRCKSYIIYKYGDYSDVRNEMQLKIAIERGIPIIAHGNLNSRQERHELITRLYQRKIECAVSLKEVLSSELIEEPRLSEGFFLIADLDKANDIKNHSSPTIIAARKKTNTHVAQDSVNNLSLKNEVKLPRFSVMKPRET